MLVAVVTIFFIIDSNANTSFCNMITSTSIISCYIILLLGLLPALNDGSVLSHLKAENGWRKVDADGVSFIEPEIFMVQNRFNVVSGKETQFEQVRI